MSQSETSPILSVVNNTSEESLFIPTVSRSDTLPEIGGDQAQGLSKLQASDGDFHAKAVVNSQYPSKLSRKYANT